MPPPHRLVACKKVAKSFWFGLMEAPLPDFPADSARFLSPCTRVNVAVTEIPNQETAGPPKEVENGSLLANGRAHLETDATVYVENMQR